MRSEICSVVSIFELRASTMPRPSFLFANGVFWSSAGKGKPYPLPIRVLSFEDTYKMQDPKYDRPPEDTYARRLRTKYDALVEKAARRLREETKTTPPAESAEAGVSDEDARGRETDVDMLLFYTQQAAATIQGDVILMGKLRSDGVPWAGVKEAIARTLPGVMEESERAKLAYELVPQVLERLFGKQDRGWRGEKRPKKSGEGLTTWIVAIPMKGDTADTQG